MEEFREELRKLINKTCLENRSNTPDFVLAEYLDNCLDAFDKAVNRRTLYYKPLPPPSVVQPAPDKCELKLPMEIKKAFEFLDECERTELLIAGNDPAIITLREVAQLYLQAASELPEREVETDMGEGVVVMTDWADGFNSCLDQVTPIFARKNEEVARLKAENEELEQELEACRDANVQKKKRIDELEDALKRAEGVPSLEEIEKEIRTWEKCKRKDNCCSSCIEDIKMGFGDDIDACCCRHKSICDLAQAIHALLTTRKGSE